MECRYRPCVGRTRQTGQERSTLLRKNAPGSKTQRSTQPTGDELKARERFAAVAAMVKARKGDLSQLSTDQDAFLAQKDQAGGKKTMRAYLWKVCGEEYDSTHQG